MARFVQKFGGTSVADPEKIVRAAKKAARRHAARPRYVRRTFPVIQML